MSCMWETKYYSPIRPDMTINDALVAANRALLDNLTAVQARCTAQEEALRQLRRNVLPEWLDANLARRIGDRLREASEKHPEGASLAALVSEVGEVATAMLRETPERTKDELLDVIVVAIRLWFGEVAGGGAK